MEIKEYGRKEFYEASQELNLKESGICLGDYFCIYPLQGKSKKVLLKRTKYLFSLDQTYKVEENGDKIILPQGILSSTSFQLTLEGRGKYDYEGKSGRFLMESLGTLPFKINGVLSFKAFIERGDLIEVGMNKISFKNPKSSSKDEFPFSQKVLSSSISVLLEGETGTGKTYLAKRIHDESLRIGKFVHINLSAFSSGLIESELFGHVKGSFTGAVYDKIGAFEEANYGTLFLDEIDSLPKETQTKLLLFLDSRKIRKVGGHEDKKLDVRILFASGRKLAHLLEQGELRKDFFYRLKSGIQLELKPLRSQRVLIHDFCFEFFEKRQKTISISLVKYYMGLDWPGNYRQLKSHLEKKILLAHGEKIVFDFVDENLEKEMNLENEEDEEKSFSTLEKLKEKYCCKVLAYYGHNFKISSEILGISLKTLRSIYKKRLASCDN